MRRGLTIGILLTAGLFWAMLLWQAEDSVFSRAPLLDEIYYLDRAAEVTAGQYLHTEPFFMSPLYPLLVAATGAGSDLSEIGTLPRGNLLGIRLLQVACWFGVVILLRRMAGRTFAAAWPPGLKRELVAWFPALLFALYRPAAVFSLSVLLELPLLLLVTLAVELMTPSGGGRARVRLQGVAFGAILGSIIGLAALLRGTALLILPIAVLAVWFEAAESGQRRRGLIALALSVLIVLAPAAIHNSLQAGRPAGPTLNGGLNLFIGNGPQANGLYMNLLPGDWRRDPAGTAHQVRKTGSQEVTVPEADALWYQDTVEAARRDPLRVLRLYQKKIWLHFQGWEIDQLVPLAGWTEEAPLLRALIVPWRVIVVLGLAGLGLLLARGGSFDWYSGRAIRIWIGVLLVLVLGQSLFFVTSRYRLVLAPVLCLLAGAGLTVWLDRAASSLRPRMFVGAAGILALVLSQPWGLGPVRELWTAQALANQAHRWALLGEAEASMAANSRAEELYIQALAGPATQAEWWLALSLVQIGLGDDSGAEATLDEGADQHPDNLEIQRTLLGLLLEQARSDEALTRAETLLAGHPEDVDTLHNYTILLARAGRKAEALESASQLISSHPEDPRGYVDRGILLARSGRIEEARIIFEQGLTVLPGHPDLEKNLSVLNGTADR